MWSKVKVKFPNFSQSDAKTRIPNQVLKDFKPSTWHQNQHVILSSSKDHFLLILLLLLLLLLKLIIIIIITTTITITIII